MEPEQPAAEPGRQRAYLVEEQPNPSTDYFVRPALSALGMEVVTCRPGTVASAAELADAVVVFVRYVPAAWLPVVERARDSIRRVVFFMDDDLLDWRAAAGMPLHYRIKLARLATGRQRWLARQRAELWVSTPHLRRKYAAWRPSLVPPTPVAGVREAVQVFYHGTASHGREIRWLRPVVEAALAREPRLCFEIIGGREVHRLYRDLPGVRVVHPMRWPAYQAFLSASVRHVGLAPQLDLPFNRARSFTKFLDITRAGAAGIYAAGSACADVVEHGVEGLIVPLEEAAWVEAITTLAGDPVRRSTLARGASGKVERLAASVRTEYETLRRGP